MTRLGMIAAMLALLGLAACGTSTQDRAISGAGLGAGGGAAVGALTGAGALEGALLGGAAGAATGALTDQEDIDLGEPIWE